MSYYVERKAKYVRSLTWGKDSFSLAPLLYAIKWNINALSPLKSLQHLEVVFYE